MWKCIVVTGCLVCSLLILGAGEMNSQEAASTTWWRRLHPLPFGGNLYGCGWLWRLLSQPAPVVVLVLD